MPVDVPTLQLDTVYLVISAEFGAWFRGKVQELHDDGTATVFYCDYGSTEHIQDPAASVSCEFNTHDIVRIVLISSNTALGDFWFLCYSLEI